MNLRHHARAGTALAAAYAVALQAVLLAVGAPIAGATGIAAIPICAHAAADHSIPPGHSTPAGHGQDCLDACLTGCCGAVPVCPAPLGAAIYAPAVAQAMVPALDVSQHLAGRVSHAHRSRAPPTGFPE